jgi:hypothetical protein
MWRSIIFFGVFPLFVQAQTGPGGVGNTASNFLWLSADQGVTAPLAGVTSWADRSGNNNHALQPTANLQPILLPSSFNGYPAIAFDNSTTDGDHLRIPDNSTLEGMNGLTGFAVFDIYAGTVIGAPRGILSKRNDPSSQNAYGWFLWNSGSNLAQHLDIDGTTNRISSPGTHSPGTVYMNGFTYHGATPTNTQDQVLYSGNTAVANGAESSTSIPNYSSDLYIGILRGHTGAGANTTRFNGRMAEVILFNTVLNSVQRTVVSNYLAAKYGLTLGSQDLYTMDNGANGNYDHDVAGIGRVSASDLHTDAQGTGIVRINNPSNLQNNEYLFWGHDNGTMGAWGVGDYPPTVQGRLQRVWRVSEVNASGTAVNVGNVDMTFDLNGLGPVNAADLRLLVDTDLDGLFADEIPLGTATDLGAGLFRFAAIAALTNGVRFTLATTNITSTPLPVELVAFDATARQEDVRLDWTTASEQNNAFFTVERSIDLEQWQEVNVTPGAGTSVAPIEYSSRDASPLNGTSYYRLRQTDLDGSSSLSQAVPVTFTEGVAVSIHPVPFREQLQVRAVDAEVLSIDLHSMTGQRIPVTVHRSGTGVWLDTSALAPGAYSIRVWTSAGSRTSTIVKEP